MNIEAAFESAGYLGLPFSWGTDGKCHFADTITEQQQAEIQSIVKAWLADQPNEKMKAVLSEVRELREKILNRLAGIGFTALASGDTKTADAIIVARQSLLDITKAPSVLAATDADELKAAVLAAYRAIVMAAPASIRTAFNAVSM